MDDKKDNNEVDIQPEDNVFSIFDTDVQLFEANLKIVERKEKSDLTIGFTAHGNVLQEPSAYVLLSMRVEKPFTDDEEEQFSCLLIFTLRGLFIPKREVSVEYVRDFIRDYSISALMPYAREYASDQLRRAGIADIYLPMVNTLILKDQLIAAGYFDVDIVNPEQ